MLAAISFDTEIQDPRGQHVITSHLELISFMLVIWFLMVAPMIPILFLTLNAMIIERLQIA